jgi:hypothetical protein
MAAMENDWYQQDLTERSASGAALIFSKSRFSSATTSSTGM